MKKLILIYLMSVGSCFATSYVHPGYEKVKNNLEVSKTFGTMDEINRYVNKTPYVAEVVDDWKTPERFFVEGGDCEDYAVAKLAMARKAGFDGEIELVVALGQVHAVLVVDGLIYDNLTNKVFKEGHYKTIGKVRM